MKAAYNEVKRPRSYLQSIKGMNYWEAERRTTPSLTDMDAEWRGPTFEMEIPPLI